MQHPKWTGITFAMTHFQPTFFWSQSGPFSRNFGSLHWPNPVAMASKRAKNTSLRIPNGPRSVLEKHIFEPFLTHFRSQNGPLPRHFGIFHSQKCVTTGSKRAKNTWLSIPSGTGSLLEKCVFYPRFPRFWSQNGPLSRHFGTFHGPNSVTTGSNRAKNTCFIIPNGQRSLLKKICVFDPLLTPFWSPNGRV